MTPLRTLVARLMERANRVPPPITSRDLRNIAELDRRDAREVEGEVTSADVARILRERR